MSIKELTIKEYFSKIDFRSDDWSLDKMKSDMRTFLGEEPAIDVEYKKDMIVNEFKGEAEEIRSLNKFSIVFTDIDNRFKKLEFLID